MKTLLYFLNDKKKKKKFEKKLKKNSLLSPEITFKEVNQVFDLQTPPV